MATVYRYRVYDLATDEYFFSTRMATKEKIARIRGEAVEDTAHEIDGTLLDDGWTAKDFAPLLDLEQRLSRAVLLTDSKKKNPQDKSSN